LAGIGAALFGASASGQPRLIELDASAAAGRHVAMRASWSTADDWCSRAIAIRRHILTTLGLPALDPYGRNASGVGARGPLHPVETPPRPHDGYFVQNVAFRSFDGANVTGNLYLPAITSGPAPAVLCPHGHFGATSDDAEGRFRRDMQIRCATLARMGAVVLAYDMVGWGESDVAEHHDPAALPLQCWNSVRAIDYLASRADVDPARIAVTGASGGGTQTFLLAALDNRVAASVPCVQVSAHFFGGCECETGLPIHTSPELVTSNVEIAAMAAPRPLLLISCGADWTANSPRVEFPAILSVYEALGAADAAEHAHLASEGHDYGPTKRRALYEFLARRLGLDLGRVQAQDGSIDERFVAIEPRAALCVYGVDRSPPPQRAAADALAALRASPHLSR
jgi:poly(3-hydroxybutyrate) depolymerase